MGSSASLNASPWWGGTNEFFLSFHWAASSSLPSSSVLLVWERGGSSLPLPLPPSGGGFETLPEKPFFSFGNQKVSVVGQKNVVSPCLSLTLLLPTILSPNMPSAAADADG